MENSKIVLTYLIYLPIIICLTIFVAKALFKNGRYFMLEIFQDNENIGLATNRLFEIGFYLINIGWGLIIMTIYSQLNDPQDMIEILSKKLGGFAMYLGLMLFLNLLLFFRGRKKANTSKKRFVKKESTTAKTL